jgi:hypothetical protein
MNSDPPLRKYFLNTYTPLVATSAGRAASETYGILPFVDGSIRREPDLEHEYPSISCLCRVGKFAPRLRVGDIVGYMTCKGRWGGLPDPHRRLTAVLEVWFVMPSHGAAARWYSDRGLSLPSNCMVPGNVPKPLDQSHRKHRERNRLGDDRLIRRWDAEYRRRASLYPVFVVCRPVFRDLSLGAPVIDEECLRSVFGRVPGTQNPGVVAGEAFRGLLEMIGVQAQHQPAEPTLAPFPATVVSRSHDDATRSPTPSSGKFFVR